MKERVQQYICAKMESKIEFTIVDVDLSLESNVIAYKTDTMYLDLGVKGMTLKHREHQISNSFFISSNGGSHVT